MNEIWTRMQEKINETNPSYKVNYLDIFIPIWWTLFLLTTFVGNFILKLAINQDTIEEMIVFLEISFITDIFDIIVALLVVFIVSKISKMESLMAEQVRNSGGKVV